MSLNKLPVNWFDFALVAILILGLLRGRKRGMSEEVIPSTKWILTIALCAIAYEPIGSFMTGMTPFSRLFCYVACYLLVLAVVAGLFALIKNAIGGKIIGSDTFGGSEYYLGMPAGMMRFACVLVAGLALLNAPLYTAKQIADYHKFQQENYGSDFFPGLQSLQSDVFEKSLTGPPIKKYLSFLLIKPTQPETKQIVRAQEKNY